MATSSSVAAALHALADASGFTAISGDFITDYSTSPPSMNLIMVGYSLVTNAKITIEHE